MATVLASGSSIPPGLCQRCLAEPPPRTPHLRVKPRRALEVQAALPRRLEQALPPPASLATEPQTRDSPLLPPRSSHHAGGLCKPRRRPQPLVWSLEGVPGREREPRRPWVSTLALSAFLSLASVEEMKALRISQAAAATMPTVSSPSVHTSAQRVTGPSQEANSSHGRWPILAVGLYF